MVDQLSSFADEVTRVAREVGTEGQLGGQARVKGVAGIWKDLTENVNQLAGNLTTQVRAIADVATAVAKGDLSRTITVDAPGELGQLKDNINRMIANLRETTRVNQEQDWLKSNLARIGAMLQGQRDLRTVSQLLMSELTPLVGAQCGAFFVAEGSGEQVTYRLMASYGLAQGPGHPTAFRPGEGLVGQAVVERKTIMVRDAPPGYLRITSGLGGAAPVNVVVLPVLFEEQVLAVVELASFRPFSAINQAFLEQIVETVGVVLNTITATMRTEELLEQSQRLAQELQARSQELQRQQEELRHTNAELQEKARQLARQNRAIEVKNAQIELARRELEERAEQLALSSRYKSEFLANMSHELRTPLNSLLILARLLADNEEGNLTEKQVEFARSIWEAGNDLLHLINDILDLSKIEAGKLDVNLAPVRLTSLCHDLEQMFRPLAEQQSLEFVVEVADGTPETVVTDERRVQQVLKNLLSNAFKFTEKGSVTLRVAPAPSGTGAPPGAVALSVTDTGVGIERDKLAVIFEAFQQADGTTSRKYGGTGLGLSISRDITRLLGGEIRVQSEPGAGSTFTLLLPLGTETPQGVPAPAETAPAGTVPARGAGEGQAGADPVPAGPAPAGRDLAGRRVLVVDDDVRNLYAIVSALEEQGMEVLAAEDGRSAIDLLERVPGIDLVLMDVMMPVMDGYETMRAIRRLPRFRDLPIVALTAKAMQADKDKCLAEGASDYVTKPVDIHRLLDVLRVWLHR